MWRCRVESVTTYSRRRSRRRHSPHSRLHSRHSSSSLPPHTTSRLRGNLPPPPFSSTLHRRSKRRRSMSCLASCREAASTEVADGRQVERRTHGSSTIRNRLASSRSPRTPSIIRDSARSGRQRPRPRLLRMTGGRLQRAGEERQRWKQCGRCRRRREAAAAIGVAREADAAVVDAEAARAEEAVDGASGGE